MPQALPPRALTLDASASLIVSDVPALTYAPEVLEPRLADLDWVSGAGAAHHQVIETLADAGAIVIPCRLFTLFSNDDTAMATFREARAALTRAFDRVRGRQEWVLRISKADTPRTPPPAASPGAVTGTNFLQAKADARREAAARATRIKEDVAAAFEALEQLADAAKTRPVDGNGTLLLDAAYLVPASRVEAMRETLTRRAERLLRDGCQVRLTGPWPAYSFASLEAHDG
jgi:hypothetical protein